MKTMNLHVYVVEIDGTYSFKTGGLSLYANDVLMVNGEIVKGDTITLNEPITSIELYSSVKKPSHVASLVDGVEPLSILEYEEKKLRLERNKNNSFDGEVEHYKFMKSYELVYKRVNEYVQSVDFDVIEMSDPQIPFITLNRHLGKDVLDVTATFDRQGF